jgi:hypothetical protein
MLCRFAHQLGRVPQGSAVLADTKSEKLNTDPGMLIAPSLSALLSSNFEVFEN